MMCSNENDPTVRQYMELIKDAITHVAPEYFNLKTTYEPSGIVRERVFCYELYHQIQCRMSPCHRLSLNGKMHKSGHIDFDRTDRKNPDFVFHIPGTHEQNTLIIEVKGTLKYRQKIMGNFQTLLTFISKYRYKAGVFILYNHSIAELITAVGEKFKELAPLPGADSVHILTIKEARSPCNESVLSHLLHARIL